MKTVAVTVAVNNNNLLSLKHMIICFLSSDATYESVLLSNRVQCVLHGPWTLNMQLKRYS